MPCLIDPGFHAELIKRETLWLVAHPLKIHGHLLTAPGVGYRLADLTDG